MPLLTAPLRTLPLRSLVALPLAAALLFACGDDANSTDAGTDARFTGRDVATVSDSGRQDSGGRDGDSQDSEGQDATADVASAREGCEGSTALFCEDFEGLPAGGATSDRWSQDTSSGSLTIDGEQARGTQALHVHTDGNGRAFLRIPFAPPANSYFGRMYIFVVEFPSNPDWAHYTLVEAAGEGGKRIPPVGGQWVPPESGAFWGIGADGGPTGDWTNWRTSAPSAPGAWTCVEWEMNSEANFIRLSLDGVDNDDLTVNTTDHGGSGADFVFPAFDNVKIGWQLYQGGPTPDQFDLWIDDIVFDTTRVGCDGI